MVTDLDANNNTPVGHSFTDCHAAASCLNSDHYGECGFWTVDNHGSAVPNDKRRHVITVDHIAAHLPGGPWRVRTVVVEPGALAKTLTRLGVPLVCVRDGHHGEYRHPEDGDTRVYTWLFTHPSLPVRREAFLYELGDMLSAGDYTGVIRAVKDRGFELGRTERWHAACNFFAYMECAGWDPAWIATQGHIGLTHANA